MLRDVDPFVTEGYLRSRRDFLFNSSPPNNGKR
jgi:hypothetical protein